LKIEGKRGTGALFLKRPTGILFFFISFHFFSLPFLLKKEKRREIVEGKGREKPLVLE